MDRDDELGRARAASRASRREFLLAGSAALAGAAVPKDAGAEQGAPPAAEPEPTGTEHWATKRVGGHEVRLFLWRKRLRAGARSAGRRGTILFVHGSSVSSTPTFDLQVAGRPEASAMDWFARLGYDTWCVDCEGYGRSDKSRSVNMDVSCGADDLAAASEVVASESGAARLLVYGESSGGLRAGLFAQRHPERVARLALDAFVWTGEGSPTLAERRKKLAQYRASPRRPLDRALVRSIFTRDHPGTSDMSLVEAFADAALARDTVVPTGTYVDMSANLPLVDPEKLTIPVLVLRGQYDGIASFADVATFFAKLACADKQLGIMPGIAHSSMRSKNWAIVYHLLDAWFSQPAPAYTG